jgi:protein ImuB
MRVICVVLDKKEKLQTVAEAALQFTPQVALGRDCVFLEISQVLNLRSEKEILQQLKELLVSMELTGRLAVGNDPGSALSFAKLNMICEREELPIEALENFLSPFNPGEELTGMLESFVKLGIYRIQDLRKVPPKTLASRFGKDALLAYQRVFYGVQVPWPAFHPQEKVSERTEIDLDHQVNNLEPMLFLIRPLLEQVLGRLRGRALKLTGFRLRFELESYSTVLEPIRIWNFDLSFAQSEAALVLPIVRERLNKELQIHPLESSVICCEVEALEAVPGVSSQKDLFCKKEEEKEQWGSLVSRLHEKLGDTKSFVAQPVARYLPEQAWKRDLSGSEAFDMSSLPKRPLVLFRKARPLHKIDNYFVYNRKRYKILDLEGPETLSGEWWLRGFHRNYYKASLSDDSQWWVYTNPEAPDYYFWHGVFD